MAGASRALARTARRTAALAAAGIAGLAALTCLLAALWLQIAPEIGAPAATLVLGLLLAAMCAGALLLARPAAAPPPPPPAALGLAELEPLLRRYKLPVLLAAVLAGAFASQSGRKS